MIHFGVDAFTLVKLGVAAAGLWVLLWYVKTEQTLAVLKSIDHSLKQLPAVRSERARRAG